MGAGGGATTTTHLPTAVGGFPRLPCGLSHLPAEAEVDVRDLDLDASARWALPAIGSFSRSRRTFGPFLDAAEMKDNKARLTAPDPGFALDPVTTHRTLVGPCRELLNERPCLGFCAACLGDLLWERFPGPLLVLLLARRTTSFSSLVWSRPVS